MLAHGLPILVLLAPPSEYAPNMIPHQNSWGDLNSNFDITVSPLLQDTKNDYFTVCRAVVLRNCSTYCHKI